MTNAWLTAHGVPSNHEEHEGPRGRTENSRLTTESAVAIFLRALVISWPNPSLDPEALDGQPPIANSCYVAKCYFAQ